MARAQTRPANSSTTLSNKEWVASVTATRTLTMQDRIVTFLLGAYAFLLLATMGIYFLQGFHVWGFQLDAALLHWIGAATVGEIGGLLTLTIRAVFRSR